MSEDIPGLAKYLPSRKVKYKDGLCKDCGKDLHWEAELTAAGTWQPNYCDDCMDAEDYE